MAGSNGFSFYRVCITGGYRAGGGRCGIGCVCILSLHVLFLLAMDTVFICSFYSTMLVIKSLLYMFLATSSLYHTGQDFLNNP